MSTEVKKDRYQVAFRKRGESKDTVIAMRVSCIENLYAAVCGIARVRDTMELESLEIHHIREDNTVEVIHQPPATAEVVQELDNNYSKACLFHVVQLGEAA